MIFQRITTLSIKQSEVYLPTIIGIRAKTKPTYPVCPEPKPELSAVYLKKTTSSDYPSSVVPPGGGNAIIRAVTPGKVRMGFIPEEWFQFFRTKTGVTGPYFLMIGVANYLASKEIYVMEHEYYSGLSVLLVLYLVTTKFGAQIGEALDKKVDAVHKYFQDDRDKDKAYYESVIKDCEEAELRAKGQKELMAAKKENIALQLEAEYRERVMRVYKAVKDRMIYQIRRKRIETRMDQWWLIEWVVKKVHESITPEFRKKALASAIRELDAIASRQKR